jgi:transcription initiation factor TFIID TATA-box-binding protein
MKVKVVNVVVKVKLPGRADLIKLTGTVPNSSYSPKTFPAAVIKDYEHDGERVSFLVFSSGNVICIGGKDPEKAKRAAKAFAKALMEKGVVERGEAEPSVENIVAMFNLGAKVDLERASQAMENVMYEPEMFPGMLIRVGKKAVLVFHSGKGIVAGARSVEEAEAIARDVGEMVRRAVAVEQTHQG